MLNIAALIIILFTLRTLLDTVVLVDQSLIPNFIAHQSSQHYLHHDLFHSFHTSDCAHRKVRLKFASKMKQ